MMNDNFVKIVKLVNQCGVVCFVVVQVFYQMDVGGFGVFEVVLEYEIYCFGQEIDGDQYFKVDLFWFCFIVFGVVCDQFKFDLMIIKVLQEGWMLFCFDSMVCVIFCFGMFELIECKDVFIVVIVNEYVEIVQVFFEEEELCFVNVVFDWIVKQVCLS